MPAPGHEIERQNLERVRQFFLSHLGATNRECSAAIGLSEYAVGRHVATLRSEWCPVCLDCGGTDDDHIANYYCPTFRAV